MDGFFKELFDIEQLKFHRCLKPDNAVGDPMLVIFSDGVNWLMEHAYVRWGTAHGGFESRLVIAKNRIAPTKQMSVPRLELCGAVLAARIRKKGTNSTRELWIRHICCYKAAEIQNKTEPSDWWWVPSEFNAADLATRITSPGDMVKNSIWKNGPKFLNDPIDQWPLRQDCNLGKRCVICRRRDNKCTGQQMGPLPLERLQPSPAFSYCSVDLFGPLTIKDTVKGRTHEKAYGVLFNCMSSRAVYMDLADGYDTSSFIMVLRRFTSVRGYPKKIRSDLGSQLVSASKELKEVIQNWHWDTIKCLGNGNGMEWEF
ncbi:unnamed protein product [Mytilus coruscus]|uniref:Integrase catalytic domain-containing protein n=1 Tax=Mytilus coruscus TaxID=42192 RepID=A0A6J8CQ00_MYTCO|nr:unnamed protein product [Mytilus coruscus]